MLCLKYCSARIIFMNTPPKFTILNICYRDYSKWLHHEKKKLLIWPLSSEILTRSHLTPPEILLNPYIRLLPGNSLSKNFQPISFLFKIICHVHQSPHSQSPHPQAPHPKSSRTPCLFNCWPLDRSLDDLVNGDLRALCLVGKIWRTGVK